MKKIHILLLVIVASIIYACKQNDYYIDGGLSEQSPQEQSLSTYDLLKQNKDGKFDSLIKIIDLTNSKDLVNQENITFFANGNPSVIQFQRLLMQNDRQIRYLNTIGVDTLKMLLKRFIVPNNKIQLADVVPDKILRVKDLNSDSLRVYGKGGTLELGSTTPSTAYRLEYMHRKIPKVDTVNYVAEIQTHNLKSSNAIIHVIRDNYNFGCGLKVKYYRPQ